VLHCLIELKHSWLLKCCASLKNQVMDKVPKKEDVSVNFSCAKFPHLDFLTLEGGTDKLSQNISKELLLSAV
jgi:hypothetical protein